MVSELGIKSSSSPRNVEDSLDLYELGCPITIAARREPARLSLHLNNNPLPFFLPFTNAIIFIWSFVHRLLGAFLSSS